MERYRSIERQAVSLRDVLQSEFIAREGANSSGDRPSSSAAQQHSSFSREDINDDSRDEEVEEVEFIGDDIEVGPRSSHISVPNHSRPTHHSLISVSGREGEDPTLGDVEHTPELSDDGETLPTRT